MRARFNLLLGAFWPLSVPLLRIVKPAAAAFSSSRRRIVSNYIWPSPAPHAGSPVRNASLRSVRILFVLLPAVLAAQAPAPKPAASKPAPAKPAAAKTAGVKPAAKKQSSAAKAAPAAPALATDDEKTIYSLGLSMYRALSRFDLSAAELELVKRGLSDAAAGKPAVELNE